VPYRRNASPFKTGLAPRFLALILAFHSGVATAVEWADVRLDNRDLNAAAQADYRIPVRPGIPGKTPYWNRHSRRFLYAPAFDFPAVAAAAKYRFRASTGQTFTGEQPYDPLTTIWADIPVGPVELVVEALDEDGNVLSVAGTRRFYRAAPFTTPYRDAVVGYRECALKGLRFLLTEPHVQHWKSSSEPDPNYSLYCYPSKVIGALVQAMALYGKLAPEHRDDALAIAKNAADYLMRYSQPADAVLAHWPPTYSGEKHAARGQNHLVMWQEPSNVAEGYLDLFDATGERVYFEAAVRIASTYERSQAEDGSWPLKADLATGKTVSEQRCIPTYVTVFLDRLVAQYGETRFAPCRDAALGWMLQNPVRTYNWTGQFEDVGVNVDAYTNLQRGDAATLAIILLSKSSRTDATLKTALELIRFCEDQFVVWDKPNPDNWGRPAKGAPQDWARDLRTWSPPCVLEQYKYYVPVDASAASMILAYAKAYEATGEQLYLAKATALANMMTIWQDMQSGYLPTRWLVGRGDINWLNCATYDIQALLTLDSVLSKTTER